MRCYDSALVSGSLCLLVKLHKVMSYFYVLLMNLVAPVALATCLDGLLHSTIAERSPTKQLNLPLCFKIVLCGLCNFFNAMWLLLYSVTLLTSSMISRQKFITIPSFNHWKYSQTQYDSWQLSTWTKIAAEVYMNKTETNCHTVIRKVKKQNFMCL